MKTGKYARDQWAVLRKKMIGLTATKAGDKADDGDGTPAPKPKATPSKRKAAGEFNPGLHIASQAKGPSAENDVDGTPAKEKTSARKPKSATPAGGEGVNVKEEPEEPNEAGEAMDELS